MLRLLKFISALLKLTCQLIFLLHNAYNCGLVAQQLVLETKILSLLSVSTSLNLLDSIICSNLIQIVRIKTLHLNKV